MKRRVLGGAVALVVALVALGAAEAGLRLVYRKRSPQGKSLDADRNLSRVYHTLFRPHPFLSVAPIPNVAVRQGPRLISHGPHGLRAERRTPSAGVRVAAIGGSSTYGVGVSDEETWPRVLEGELGSGVEVLNFGVPGYTTAEHVIQTALGLSDLAPRVAIYYVGWNDVRSFHVADVDSYYADFHGRSQPSSLRIDRPVPPRSALLFFLGRAFARGETVPRKHDAAERPERDARGEALYGRNLRLIAALCRAQAVEPLFAPQVMNCDRLRSDVTSGWAPFVADRDLCAAVGVLNERMRAVAAEEGVAFVAPLESTRFGPDDFLDTGHFTAAGGRKLAEAVTPAVRAALERAARARSEAPTPAAR
jgi:lysophospholipase L1-like esterase